MRTLQEKRHKSRRVGYEPPKKKKISKSPIMILLHILLDFSIFLACIFPLSTSFILPLIHQTTPCIFTQRVLCRFHDDCWEGPRHRGSTTLRYRQWKKKRQGRCRRQWFHVKDIGYEACEAEKQWFPSDMLEYHNLDSAEVQMGSKESTKVLHAFKSAVWICEWSLILYWMKTRYSCLHSSSTFQIPPHMKVDIWIAINSCLQH